MVHFFISRPSPNLEYFLYETKITNFLAYKINSKMSEPIPNPEPPVPIQELAIDILPLSPNYGEDSTQYLNHKFNENGILLRNINFLHKDTKKSFLANHIEQKLKKVVTTFPENYESLGQLEKIDLFQRNLESLTAKLQRTSAFKKILIELKQDRFGSPKKTS
jgi:hypothetical protein